MKPAYCYLLPFEGLYRINSSPSLGLFISRTPLPRSPASVLVSYLNFLLGLPRSVSALSRSVLLAGLVLEGSPGFCFQGTEAEQTSALHSAGIYYAHAMCLNLFETCSKENEPLPGLWEMRSDHVPWKQEDE